MSDMTVHMWGEPGCRCIRVEADNLILFWNEQRSTTTVTEEKETVMHGPVKKREADGAEKVQYTPDERAPF